MSFSFFPNDCVSHILSFTSPKDVCRCCVVSSMFQSAADSNTLWKAFLPPDYEDILLRSVSPFSSSSSMKDLYFKLTLPFLVDEGKMSFSLERSSGKKCYRLSARELSITWGDDPLYWAWKPHTQSRFAEVAELRTTYWLEIRGRISSMLLSPSTEYAAYLIFKIEDRAYGLDTLPSEVSVEVGDDRYENVIYLRRCNNNKGQLAEQRHNRHCTGGSRCKSTQMEEVTTCGRNDGWLELELGAFFNYGKDREVRMSLMEVNGVHLRGGLVIEGIEVRPKEKK